MRSLLPHSRPGSGSVEPLGSVIRRHRRWNISSERNLELERRSSAVSHRSPNRRLLTPHFRADCPRQRRHG